MAWIANDGPRYIAHDEIVELRKALDTITGAESALTVGVFFEIALNHLQRARAVCWDHYESQDRQQIVAELDFCGIPHPMLHHVETLEV
jgi:hypothetical protein